MSLAPDVAWQVFAIATLGVAVASLTAWAALWAHVPTSIAATVAGLAACAAAGVAWSVLRRRRTAAGVLVWDGAGWQWTPEAAEPDPGELVLMIDLGAWLLLRFTPARPAACAVWLVAARRHAAAQWPAWRAALYSRRPGIDPLAPTHPA